MLYEGRNEDARSYVRVAASPATRSNGTCRWYTTTAWPSASIPRRPARPVSCVYSPGVTSSCRSPWNFHRSSITTLLAGMLIPSERVSVANTTFTSPSWKSSSTVSLNSGSMPGVVGGDPRA